jgi:hypothetical protein
VDVTVIWEGLMACRGATAAQLNFAKAARTIKTRIVKMEMIDWMTRNDRKE